MQPPYIRWPLKHLCPKQQQPYPYFPCHSLHCMQSITSTRKPKTTSGPFNCIQCAAGSIFIDFTVRKTVSPRCAFKLSSQTFLTNVTSRWAYLPRRLVALLSSQLWSSIVPPSSFDASTPAWPLSTRPSVHSQAQLERQRVHAKTQNLLKDGKSHVGTRKPCDVQTKGSK